MTQYEKILTYTIDEMAEFACSKVCMSCEQYGYCDGEMKDLCVKCEKELLMKEVEE